MTHALQAEMHFDGSDYNPARDGKRLAGQILRVYDFIRDCRWYTLNQIAAATHAPHSSVSAQLRNLRKPRFGGHKIIKHNLGGGLWVYRMDVTQ